MEYFIHFRSLRETQDLQQNREDPNGLIFHWKMENESIGGPLTWGLWLCYWVIHQIGPLLVVPKTHRHHVKVRLELVGRNWRDTPENAIKMAFLKKQPPPPRASISFSWNPHKVITILGRTWWNHYKLPNYFFVKSPQTNCFFVKSPEFNHLDEIN